MTPADLRAWQVHMALSQRAASVALGITQGTYSAMVTGKTAIDRRTGLACAALAANLDVWVKCPPPNISVFSQNAPTNFGQV